MTFGFCLAIAFYSVMDKPGRIAVAVIGDAENETGPTAAAWHTRQVRGFRAALFNTIVSFSTRMLLKVGP